VADIIFSPGDFCWGVIFDVTQADIDIIDVKEGADPKNPEDGAYKQLKLSNDVVTYGVVKKERFVRPHNDYVDLIIHGARSYGLPPDWIRHLESFKL
jgi:hypothetical protein